MMTQRAIVGLLVSAVIAGLGWRARALSAGGMIAAIVVGSAVIIGTSWAGALVLGTFFATSSVLSGIREPFLDVGAKGSRRDAWQVIANGGAAALAAAAALVISERPATLVLAGGLAVATADTWATEIGRTSRRPPRLLVSRMLVDPGVSGGVTHRGLAAATAGAMTIAVVAVVVTRLRFCEGVPIAAAVGLTMAGICGSLLDSLLGETVQEKRRCPRCSRLTESRIHRCGARTELVAGVRGIDNDVVNLMATSFGALVALGLTLVV